MEDKQTILKLYEMCVDDIYKMTSVDLELSKKINEKEDLLNLTKEQKNILEEINNYKNERKVLKILNKTYLKNKIYYYKKVEKVDFFSNFILFLLFF